MMVFPIQGDKIHTRLAIVDKNFMDGIEGQTYTIVPMINADIYWPWNAARRGPYSLRAVICCYKFCS